MREKPKVGQIVYDSPRSHRASKREPNRLNVFFVKKVGRKYFYAGPENCSIDICLQYYIKDWRQVSNYSVSSVLYASKQEYADAQFCIQAGERLYHKFKYGHSSGLPIEALKEITTILDRYERED